MTPLDALLERNRINDLASGGPGVNNHVPMTLIALHRMGADSDRLRRYAENFAATPVKTAPEPITRENWRDRLGDAPYAAYAAFFDAWIARTTVDAVLRESLATLMNGQAGSAFHPLLRLGYALDYKSTPEIAASLAYWASTYQPNPDFDAAVPPVDPALQLADASDLTTPLNITLDNSIVSRMSQVYASPLFRAALRPVRFSDAEPLSRMSELVMDAKMAPFSSFRGSVFSFSLNPHHPARPRISCTTAPFASA